ncbi:glycoside hydrolase family 3 N-terminal domain-containing protein [Rhodococcoides trifolii]|uniref:glycoside hydrolase family 3 N-terminal domain-containing protein n=1 Tax=Rhodococcoides trifolii TaxID=908250 RepID=UPI00166F41F8|nr:glycoside hydrolase family 3 N-terminal domain-containing protein [Rhodococcus trifolii]
MRIRRMSSVLAATVILAAACSSSDGSVEQSPVASTSVAPLATSAPPATSAPAAATQSADSCTQFLTTLTLRQKLAQLLTVGVTGTADAVQVASAEGVGGIFVGSWTDQTMLTSGGVAQAQAASAVPMMVTIDEEGGRVSRVADLLGEDPSARVTAGTMTPEQTYEMALERGRGLKNFGITVDFAPVVDVSAQDDDEVIGDRSYSDDPAVVTQYADAYARGLRDAGIFPVLKHFPGHGSSSGDSHTGAVSVPPLDELKTKDLIPYRTLVTSGAGVMVGHLDVPGLTTEGVPASISPEAMALLRDGTGYGAPPFTGPIFTDDLSGMAAITSRLGIDRAVEAALVAGADVALWLTTDDVPQVLDHLEQVVASGELTPERVDAAVLTNARAKGVVQGC